MQQIMNTPVPIMFAHGEQVVLPALLLIAALVLIFYPGALWVVASSRDRSHRRSVVVWAVLLALICGSGAGFTLKDFSWPPELGEFIGFVIWAIPAGCGVVALIKVATSVRNERNVSN